MVNKGTMNIVIKSVQILITLNLLANEIFKQKTKHFFKK